jgi:hypothetical protein
MFELKRTLFFELDGKVVEGSLYVGEVQWNDAKSKWACSWSVSHIHPEVGRVYGCDPLDAVVAALDFLSCLLRGSELDGLSVWWKERGDHAGLVFALSEARKWEQGRPIGN